MSSGDTTTPSTSSESREEIKDLDLSSTEGHARTVEWVRNNVILASDGAKPEVLQLNVKLPEEGQVTLFMDPKDHYILGFKGRDKVYLLNDKNRDTFEKQLVGHKLVDRKEDIVRIDQGADHPALGTLGRTFGMSELTSAARLSGYSSKDPRQTYEDVKGPMSLLVCMIAECSRVKSMEWAFRGIYYHDRVEASEAIQSYDDAKSVVRLADQYFPKFIRAHGVEKLEKRAAEMGQLLEGIESSVGRIDNRKQLVQDVLDGKLAKKEGRLGYQVERLAEMANELGIRNADDLVLVITRCKNKVAVQAAKDGVSVPPIARAARA